MGMFDHWLEDEDFYGTSNRRQHREDGAHPDSYNAGWVDGRDHTKKGIISLVEKLKADCQVPGKHTEFVTYRDVIKLIKSYGI